MKRHVWPTLLWFTGLIAVWVGERLIGVGRSREVVSALGAVAVVAVVVIRLVSMAQAPGAAKRGLGYQAIASSLGLLALAMYGGQLLLAGAKGANAETAGVILGGLWPAVVAVAGTVLVFVELASATIDPEALELRRLGYSAAAGTVIALSVVFAFAVNYVGSEISAHWDTNKYRTTKPSEATRNQLKAVEGEIEALAFFPNPNEVREEVLPYLDDLARGSNKLKVTRLDHALEPSRAKAVGVSGNGNVVFVKGSQHETVFVGTDMSAAKSRLSALDNDVRKALVNLSHGQRIAYFVTGHGEREADAKDPADTRGSIRTMRQVISESHYQLKDLTVATGLGKEVPADASVVFIVNPQSAPLPEEIDALRRYLEGGGKLWAMLDANSKVNLNELIGPYGLRFDPDQLLNDAYYLAKDHRPTDMANIVAVRFGSHASVTTLSKYSGHAPVAFLGSGYLEELPKKVIADAKSFITVYAMPQTWADSNGDGQYQTTEKRNAYPLMAAVEQEIKEPKGKQPMRMLVTADTDVFSDLGLGFSGLGPLPAPNLQLFIDGLKWLGGDEATSGELPPPEDPRIQHTKKQDAAWFYGTAVLAPAAVLGVGVLVTRRRRSPPRRS